MSSGVGEGPGPFICPTTGTFHRYYGSMPDAPDGCYDCDWNEPKRCEMGHLVVNGECQHEPF